MHRAAEQWAEQYEDGFFTIIDHDGGNRHYVGNFVGDMPQAQGGNDKYTVQGWAFEEIPGCPMVSYPGDWDHWSVTRAAFDDYGDQKTAVRGANWQRPAAVGGVQPSQLVNLTPAAVDTTAASDWAQHEYTGYGFQLWAGAEPFVVMCSLRALTADSVVERPSSQAAGIRLHPDPVSVPVAHEAAVARPNTHQQRCVSPPALVQGSRRLSCGEPTRTPLAIRRN